MADESKSYRDVLSRRRFVELAGVSGAAALAGCEEGGSGDTETSSDDSMDTETSEDGETDSKIYDQRHNGVTTVNPAKLQFNPSNTTNGPEVSDRVLFEGSAQYNYSEGGFVPAGITEWEYTGDTFEMILRDGLQWSNGDAVTSADVKTQLELAMELGSPIESWAESVETPDDKTIVINIGSKINPALVESDVFSGAIQFLKQDKKTYGPKLKKVKNGGEEAASKFRSFKDTDPLTNGIFNLEDRDEQILLSSRNENHPDADNINFSEYAFNKLDGNQQRQQALLSLDVDSDYSLPVPARIVADFPDAIEEVTIPDVFGIGLNPNHNDKHAGDRAVRQAIAYVINRDLVVQNSLPRAKQTPEIPTGIASGAQDQWLGDEMDTYESYGRGKKMTKKATKVLQDAGYEKVDGSWQDSDGETVSLPVTVPSGWSDWVLAAETAVQHLNEFGFDASVNGTGDYWGVIASGEFTLVANTWLHGGPTTYPYKSLRHQLYESQLHQTKNSYPGYRSTDGLGGQEADITVPSRTGSGEITVSPKERFSTFAKTSDTKKIKNIVRELAWVANQDLPMIPLAEKQLQSWLTSDDWAIPENVSEHKEAQVAFAPTWLPHKGLMNYRG